MDTNEHEWEKQNACGSHRHDLLLAKEVYAIVGAAMEVHTELGAGFAEAVYQEAMEFELGDRTIPFERQKVLTISHKKRQLEKTYVADLVCFGQVIVELKCLPEITVREEAQVLNYLKATGLRVAIIICFGDHGRLEWRRLVR